MSLCSTATGEGLTQRDLVGPWLDRFDHTCEQFSLLAGGRVLYPAVTPLDDGRIVIIGSSPSPIATPIEDLRRAWYFDPIDDSVRTSKTPTSVFRRGELAVLSDPRPSPWAPRVRSGPQVRGRGNESTIRGDGQPAPDDPSRTAARGRGRDAHARALGAGR